MAFKRVAYKQTCMLCKKNKVLITSYRQKPICVACGMKEFSPVTQEPFKTLFDIPLELYTESSFLRSIRSNYHKYGSLSEKQVEVFKRVAKEMQEKKSSPAPTGPAPQTPGEIGEEILHEDALDARIRRREEHEANALALEVKEKNIQKKENKKKRPAAKKASGKNKATKKNSKK